MTLTRAELEQLTTTDISLTTPSAELDLALATPPFLRPLLNLRDLGHVPNSAIRPGLLYRSAMLRDDDVTRAWIAKTVRAVFDLRAEREITSSPDPVVDGVLNVWNAPESVPPSIVLERFDVGDGSAEWCAQYLVVAELYRPTIKAVLAHVRDRADEPILFHCTAGRDRTGVLAGILHSLAGTPQDDIVYDYMLTRVGLEPGRALLEAKLKQIWKITDVDNTPGWANFASLRPTYWHAFGEGIKERYGGFDGYVTGHLGFSEEDLETIKRNLRA